MMIPCQLSLTEQWDQMLRTTLLPALQASAQHRGTDRYRKHFFTLPHVVLVLFHHLTASDSLTETLDSFLAQPALAQKVGLSQGVSLSQVSRSNAYRSPQVLLDLLALLLARLRAAHGSWCPQWPRGLWALDATFLHLCAKLAPWAAQPPGHQPGVKVQLLLELSRLLPHQVVFSLKRGSDRQDLPELLGPLEQWRGHTLLFDLGYYSHRWFGQLLAAGVHFLTRLHPTAAVEVAKPLELTPEDRRYGVIQDALVWLGRDPKSKLKEPVRLVQVLGEKGKVYSYLTSRWDLAAWEVAEIYRLRWQIELFFRWVKRTIHILHPLGYNQNAVQWTVLSALLAYLLVRWVQGLVGRCPMARARRLAKKVFILWGSHELILDAPT